LVSSSVRGRILKVSEKYRGINFCVGGVLEEVALDILAECGLHVLYQLLASLLHSLGKKNKK